jgi:hypothetical protein
MNEVICIERCGNLSVEGSIYCEECEVLHRREDD